MAFNRLLDTTADKKAAIQFVFFTKGDTY